MNKDNCLININTGEIFFGKEDRLSLRDITKQSFENKDFTHHPDFVRIKRTKYRYGAPDLLLIDIDHELDEDRIMRLFMALKEIFLTREPF